MSRPTRSTAETVRHLRLVPKDPPAAPPRVPVTPSVARSRALRAAAPTWSFKAWRAVAWAAAVVAILAALRALGVM